MIKTTFNPFKNGRKKNLFCYKKSLRGNHTEKSILKKDEIVYSTNEAKADTLNQHFATLFVHDADAKWANILILT